jgi:mRNA interferase HigB
MRIVARKTVVEYYLSPEGRDAEASLSARLDVVGAAQWANLNELRSVYPSADLVGHCVVFDIHHNRFRLVAFVKYRRGRQNGIVYIRRIMTHAEYDRNRWQEPCGCLTPPPKRRTTRGQR